MKKLLTCTLVLILTRVRDKTAHIIAIKKLNRHLEKVADSFGNFTDI